MAAEAQRKPSWLSPIRRRTTSNLKKAASNEQQRRSEGDEVGSPMSPPATPIYERLRSTPRSPLQPPFKSTASNTRDGNLFYAFAQKVVTPERPGNVEGTNVLAAQSDNLHARFLLTFASASIAQEWWSLVQAQFPDCTRPSPQLFSFQTDELLLKAWKHPSLEHLKTKWMYVSFSDTDANGVGGAAQGIIPLQDEQGNMLGGSAPTSPLSVKGKKAEKEMKREADRFEERLEKLIEAVEKNTQAVKHMVDDKAKDDPFASPQGGEGGIDHKGGNMTSQGHTDLAELSGQLGRIAELLAKNAEHIDKMTQKQAESHERLQHILEGDNYRQQNNRLDVEQLSGHFDRIHTSMDRSLQERREHADALQAKLANIEMTPLAERLDKVQETIDGNSHLRQSWYEKAAKHDTAELDRSQTESMKDILSTHLDRVQDLADRHATATSNLDARRSSDQDTLNTHLAEISESLRALIQKSAASQSEKNDFTAVQRRLDASDGQVRQLMSGQREMVEVLRDLATAIKSKESGCGHVVVPPPRKVGRKLVGFVYE